MADATLIDGKAIAAALRQRFGQAAQLLRQRHRVTAGLAAVLVGDDPATPIYLRNKARARAEAGLPPQQDPTTHGLPGARGADVGTGDRRVRGGNRRGR